LKKSLPFALKKLGQHYLNDESIIDLICSDFSNTSYPILEIGPGPGILTQNLAAQNVPLKVIEKDTRFEENLLAYLRPEQIIWADALRIDFTEVFKEWEKFWLVSNLPYNVASPLLVNFLQCPNIQVMTLMFQKEVGDRILTEDMNSLGALTSTFFNIKELCKVPPGAFLPPPKVDSIVLSFERIDRPEVDLAEFDRFESFLRNLFKMRRKQVAGVLKRSYGKEKVEQVLLDLNIDVKTRAETFSLAQVIGLYRGFNGN